MIWEVLFLMLMSSVGQEFEQDTVQMALGPGHTPIIFTD